MIIEIMGEVYKAHTGSIMLNTYLHKVNMYILEVLHEVLYLEAYNN
jgi:hypothetical protein